jgi:hypothetical protein
MEERSYKLALEKIAAMGCEYGDEEPCRSSTRAYCRSCLALAALRGAAPGVRTKHDDEWHLRWNEKEREKYQRDHALRTQDQ